jgi:hypothetical protein
MADKVGPRGQRAGLADRQKESGVGEPPVHFEQPQPQPEPQPRPPPQPEPEAQPEALR